MAAPGRDDLTDWEIGRIRAYELTHELQQGSPTAVADLDALYEIALAEDWREVVRATMFGRIVAAWFVGSRDARPLLEAFIERCSVDGDLTMLATGLAMRSTILSGDDPMVLSAANADLARATVLLEQAEHDRALELISAYTATGIGFWIRQLYELAEEQYAAGLRIGETAPPGSVDCVITPIAFNRAEAQVSWACALRQLGTLEAIPERAQVFEETRREYAALLPEPWRRELDALSLVMAVLGGDDRAEEARHLLGELDGADGETARIAGHLRFAVALAEVGAGRPGALESVETAIAVLDPSVNPHEYDLALHLAAEVEAAGGHRSGLRSSTRQFSERWADRLVLLASMQARIEANRRSGELETLRRHAHLDDMTGLGNRRALDRYLEAARGSQMEKVALSIVDLDEFKAVNDRFGHAAGDDVLIAVAEVLQSAIRPDDLAIRLGGDELAVVIAETDATVARARMREVAEQIDALRFETIDPELRVTVSIGVAAGPLSRVEHLKAEADAALYVAKATAGERTVSRVEG